MNLYLNVETPDADGPVLAVGWWEHRAALSRMGGFRGMVAAGEARARSLLQPKRVVRCWGVDKGQRVEVGAGIIERVTLNSNGTLLIEGDDLLRELTYRRVQGLALYNEATYAPDLVLESAGVFTTLTNATDGNPATYDAISLAATGDFLYIGLPLTFNTLDIALSLGNALPATAQWGFSDSTNGWREPIVTDGTILAGVPLGQSGAVEFVRPGGWTPRTINSLSRYWMRLDPSAAMGPIRINEVVAKVRSPNTNDVSDIMGYAPSGWSLDLVEGYGGTTNGTMTTFAEETVLAALVQTAERTGEQFRLGEGREIEWLRTATPDSGVAVMDATLLAIEELRDSEPLITRVYPFGAGNGVARVTLRDTNLLPPVGYTLNTTDNYIVSSVAETTYGRIEGVLYRKEIGASDGSAAPDQSASNELFRAALAWLQQRDSLHRFYTLTVAGVTTAAKVGSRVQVLYRQAGNGLVFDVNDDFIVLERTVRITPDGLVTTRLHAATVARWVDTESDVLASVLARAESYMHHAQGVSGESVR